VPQTVFGKLLYRVVKQKPLTIDFGRKNALQLKTGDLNLKGIKPVGKTSSKLVTYTPIRRRPKKENEEEKKETAATASPVPKIAEVTSALFDTATTKKDKGKKKDKETAKREDKGKKNREKNRGKQAVATAA